MTVVILGCGYTGEHVARRMMRYRSRVICTSRDITALARLRDAELIALDTEKPFTLDFVPPESLVLHSIPPLDNGHPDAIVAALGNRPKRLVYLSTTGVYGDQRDVSESSRPAPRHERDWQRLRTEEAVLTSGISSIVLRPAAIYGPGRGIHVSMAEGRFRLVGDGNNFVSRIHVEDLATHIERALLTDISGAFPVADEQPCTSLEIAKYTARLLRMPLPERCPAEEAHYTRRADRRVDGSAIRKTLNITLQYPSYRQGIPAALKFF